MRRDVRKRHNQNDELNMKIIKYSSIGIAILAVVVFALLLYSKNLNDEVKEGTLTSEQLTSILNNTNTSENTESASTDIGKSVNELEENNSAVNNMISNSENNIANNNNILTTNKIAPVDTSKETNSDITNNIQENEIEEKTVELSFERPVDGDIVRDFAIDNLIYSETLQEWTTHTGIDIKSDKTTVVKAAEAGTVKSIKNDPRYGLTIVIEHANGFQTIYSNLLSSEFVVEGENVEKGQSLGTVGNTAAFEIADEAHLHFEILKDLEQVNPNLYLK